ncbi:MAG: LacI family transcriptional regulator [Firmicutes bacterium]|nr:LacI family transcriptional regulator [Bacillota bacterium]
MTTIMEVARAAGVSKSTVSRVLNGVPVSEEARRRVEAAIAALNFKPNAQARGLSLRRSHLIGVVVPEIARIFYGEVLEGIESALAETGFEMIVCSTRNRQGREWGLTKLLWSKRVDGLILVTPREFSPQALKSLKGEFPVVLVDGTSDSFSSISVDNFAGGFMATEHLLRLGHRRIGLILGPDTRESDQRLRGYKKALADYDCRFVPELIRSGDYLFDSGFTAMEELLALPERPTAVFAASDLMAIGALKAAEAHGIKVPEDLALVGFDDIEAARWTSPALTTIRQPLRQLGEIGGRTIVKAITKKNDPTKITLGCTLVVRESCGAFRRRMEGSRSGRSPDGNVEEGGGTGDIMM